MDILFMGTPAFACPSLSALLKAGHRVVAVVTRTDKPRGRSGKPVPSEVKHLAREHGLNVLTTETASSPDFVERLAQIKPQLGVVAAFGEKLSRDLLAVPDHGFINVHASLLPKYRGAAPITWAVVNGEKQTGVTVFRLEERLDAGPILLQRAIDIGPDETAGELHDRLADLGAQILLEAVSAIENSAARFVPQGNEGASRAPILKKNDGLIRWDAFPIELKNFVRGMTPWPGAYSFLKRKGRSASDRIVVLAVDIAETNDTMRLSKPGAIIAVRGEGIVAAVRDGAVLIRKLKPAGGREMSAGEYVLGHMVAPGDAFHAER